MEDSDKVQDSPQDGQAAIVIKGELDKGLATIKQQINMLTVATPDAYREMCVLVLAARNYVKDVGAKLDPGINSAKAHLDFLKNEKAKYVDPAKQIGELGAQKAEAYAGEERRKAKVEEDRINAQRAAEQRAKAEAEANERNRIAEEIKQDRIAEIRRMLRLKEISKRQAEKLLKEAGAEEEAYKARVAADAEEARNAPPPPPVKVEAAIPKVSGVKRRVNFKFEVVDASKVGRQWLMPDEVAIGTKVRGDKDAAKSEREIGGIRVIEEDSI